MLPVVLLIGLDVVQADACRSVLDGRARVIAVLEAEDAVALLSLHRPKLAVMRTEIDHHQRRILSDLVLKTNGRVASVSEKASAASVEHLVESFAAVALVKDEDAEEQRIASGTRERVRPGEYHFNAPRTPAVSSKAKR